MKKLIGFLVVVFVVAAVGVAVACFNFTNGCIGWDGTKGVFKTTAGNILIQPAGGTCTIDGALVVDSCTGCDYVFGSGYKLLPFDDLQAYINANHRLPGFSRDEDGKTNVNVTISQLTEKTEEQALYILQLHEALKDLGTRLASLERAK